MEAIVEDFKDTTTSTGVLKLSGLDQQTRGYLVNEVKAEVTSPNFNAVIHLNGQPFGSPDIGSLETGKLPDTPDSFGMLLSFTLPDNARSTVDCQIVIRSAHRANATRFGKERVNTSMVGTTTLLAYFAVRGSVQNAQFRCHPELKSILSTPPHPKGDDEHSPATRLSRRQGTF